jgi:hypothetical protein
MGDPYIMRNIPNTLKDETTVWSYDNSESDQPFEQEWSEKWTETRSAELSISVHGKPPFLPCSVSSGSS